eukprot:tig00020688_g12987.t1
MGPSAKRRALTAPEHTVDPDISTVPAVQREIRVTRLALDMLLSATAGLNVDSRLVLELNSAKLECILLLRRALINAGPGCCYIETDFQGVADPTLIRELCEAVGEMRYLSAWRVTDAALSAGDLARGLQGSASTLLLSRVSLSAEGIADLFRRMEKATFASVSLHETECTLQLKSRRQREPSDAWFSQLLERAAGAARNLTIKNCRGLDVGAVRALARALHRPGCHLEHVEISEAGPRGCKGPKLLNGPSEPTEKRSKPAPGRIGKPSKRPREKGWVPSCADAEGPYDFLGLVLDAMRRNDDANADAAGGFSGSSSDSDRCPTPVLDQPSAGAANGKGADSEHRRATAQQAPATQARPAEHAYYKAKAVDVAPAPRSAAPMWIRVLRPPSAGPAAAVGGGARRVEVEWRAGLGAVLGAASAALGERVVELWDGALNGVDDGAQLRPAGLYFAVTPADLARV